MSELTHTPGPWSQGQLLLTKQTVRLSADEWDQNEAEEKCRVFARFNKSDEGRSRQLIAICECEEDARFIAANPDLLEALQNLLGKYVALINSGDAGNWDPEEEKEVIAARTAIAKAKGLKP